MKKQKGVITLASVAIMCALVSMATAITVKNSQCKDDYKQCEVSK